MDSESLVPYSDATESIGFWTTLVIAQVAGSYAVEDETHTI